MWICAVVKFLWAKSSHANRNMRDLEFHVRAIKFPTQISLHAQVGHVNLLLNLLLLKVTCELYFIPLYTIDNGHWACVCMQNS